MHGGLFKKRPRSGGRVVQKPAPSHFVIQSGPLRVGRAVARKARHELKILKNRSPNLNMPKNTDLFNPEKFCPNSGLDDIKL
jgi:hypothetical protein